jgi:hypothetical protein
MEGAKVKVVERIMSNMYVLVDVTGNGKLSEGQTDRIRTQAIGEQRETRPGGNWKYGTTTVQNGSRCNCPGYQREHAERQRKPKKTS